MMKSSSNLFMKLYLFILYLYKQLIKWHFWGNLVLIAYSCLLLFIIGPHIARVFIYSSRSTLYIYSLYKCYSLYKNQKIQLTENTKKKSVSASPTLLSVSLELKSHLPGELCDPQIRSFFEMFLQFCGTAFKNFSRVLIK